MYLNFKAQNKTKFLNLHKELIGNNKIRKSSDIIYDQFIIDNNVITFYKNLTILVDGELNGTLKNKFKLLLDKKMYLGSDEVGVGENIGPIIVCAYKFNNEKDKEIGFFSSIKDSKKMNYDEIHSKAKILKSLGNAKCKILTPEKFNNLYKNIPNVKKINAMLHNKLHFEFNTKEESIIDAFIDRGNFLKYLENEENKMDFSKTILLTKAEEQYLEVACAAIIAKDLYNEWIIDFCTKNNIPYKLGKKIDLASLWSYVKNNKESISNYFQFVKNW